MQTGYFPASAPVSYTHLDFVVTVPFKLVVGVTVVFSELAEPVELVLT